MSLKEKSNQRAVLFDMDGVVIDGMPMHVEAWQEAFRQQTGYELPALLVYLAEGYKEDHFIRYACAELGITLSPEEKQALYQIKLTHYQKIFTLKPIPGVIETLNRIHEWGHPIALVTGAVSVAAERALNELGVRELFGVVAGSDLVSQGKPNPEPYLKAAQQLEILPKNCLVIENAPAGIQSAKSAGMTCLALCTSLEKNYLTLADGILSNHQELQAILIEEHQTSRGVGGWRF